MDLPDHEMINPSRNIKREGLKAYSKRKLIGLESALSSTRGLENTFERKRLG